jgi:transposase-like protein
VHRPARTIVLPVPLSRMVAPYTIAKAPRPNIGTAHLIPGTNPLERLNKEVKRRADVVGIFPNEDSIVRLIGAVLFEQNDEWLGQHRYMQVEAFAQIDAVQSDPLLSIATQAA